MIERFNLFYISMANCFQEINSEHKAHFGFNIYENVSGNLVAVEDLENFWTAYREKILSKEKRDLLDFSVLGFCDIMLHGCLYFRIHQKFPDTILHPN